MWRHCEQKGLTVSVHFRNTHVSIFPQRTQSTQHSAHSLQMQSSEWWGEKNGFWLKNAVCTGKTFHLVSVLVQIDFLSLAVFLPMIRRAASADSSDCSAACSARKSWWTGILNSTPHFLNVTLCLQLFHHYIVTPLDLLSESFETILVTGSCHRLLRTWLRSTSAKLVTIRIGVVH